MCFGHNLAKAVSTLVKIRVIIVMLVPPYGGVVCFQRDHSFREFSR